MAGRKTKLTPELQQALCDALRGGCYVETACTLVGVDESTYYRWLEKGEKGQQPYREFRDAVKKAEAKVEELAVGTILRQGLDPKNPNWVALMTFLERRFPGRWGRRNRIDMSNADGKPFVVKVVRFGEDDHGGGTDPE
jgi:hypothetical protein